MTGVCFSDFNSRRNKRMHRICLAFRHIIESTGRQQYKVSGPNVVWLADNYISSLGRLFL